MRGFAPLGLAFALSACASLSEPQIAEEPPYDLSEELAPQGAPAPPVFVLAKGDSRIAVFGTTHLVPERLQWLSPETQQELAASDLIFTETSFFQHEDVAISRDEAGDLAQRTLLPPGRTLWAMAEARLGKEAVAQIKRTMIDDELNPALYTASRPWLVCRDLQIPPRLRRRVSAEDRQMIANLSASYGLPDIAPPDLKIEMYGVSHGIETRFLESEFVRAANFSRLDDAEALDCAAASAAKPARHARVQAAAEDYAELLNLWISGDIDKVRARMEREQSALSPGWAHLFLQGREAGWMDQIVRDCDDAQRHCFVAVGMAHLGGPDGLMRRLEGLGYRRVAAPGG